MKKVMRVVKASAASVLVSIILIFVFSFIAYKFRLSVAQISLCTAVIYVAGSFIAGFGLGRISKEKRLLWGLCGGAVYFVMVFAVSLFVSHGIPAGASSIIIRNVIICIASGIIGGIVG